METDNRAKWNGVAKENGKRAKWNDGGAVEMDNRATENDAAVETVPTRMNRGEMHHDSAEAMVIAAAIVVAHHPRDPVF